MPNILIVEDDPAVRDIVQIALEREGMSVEAVGDGEAALRHFRSAGAFDLVVLDIMLPGIDGISLCQELRKTSDVPVVMLTARDGERSVVLGLEVGADDYVTKPYRLAELLARIDAVMRRAGHPSRELVDRAGDVHLDHASRRVAVAGEEVALTRKEFELLSMLVQAGGDIVTREVLMEAIWDTAWVGSSRTLDVHVSGLRSKLGRPGLVETVRGVGYRVHLPE
jgi:DNA-binding response OmpR family regulator